MDILSHALWGAAAVRTKNAVHKTPPAQRVSPWRGAFWGAFPDLFAFAGPFIMTSYGRLLDNQLPPMGSGKFDHRAYELPYIELAESLYNYSHSLVVFLLLAGAVWLLRKRPPWVLIGWPIHILMDIPGHTRAFFPTPVFFPLSDWTFDGISWGDPRIFVPNVLGLIAIYAWLAIRARTAKHP